MNSKDAYKNKKVVVLGLARSGEAAAVLLHKLGSKVLVSDQKDEEQQRNIADRLKSNYPDMSFYLGGHPEEIFNGADLVVISPGVPYNIPILEKARKNGIPIIGEIELAYRVCSAPIIAITGTKGKSTTSTLTGQILSKGFLGNVIVAGNIGSPLSNYVLDLTESDLLVLEISSFQLETTVNFRPKVGVILNIMQDHMDRHSDMNEYISAKYRILANQTSDDYTILNAENPLSAICESYTKGKVILFSSQNKLKKGIYIDKDKVIANIERPLSICNINEIKIPGRHNIENILAATAISMIYNVSPEIISDVVKNFNGIENALEFVGEKNGIKFINDTKATNVLSLKAALESINNGIILIIGGRDKGNDYTSVIPLIKQKVKQLIIIGESAEKIERSLGNLTKSYRAETMEEAVFKAYETASSGDSVLLSPACASFDMFRDYAERGKIFKEIASRIIRGS